MDEDGRSRRRFLTGCATALGASAAGCVYAPGTTATADGNETAAPAETQESNGATDPQTNDGSPYAETYSEVIDSVVEMQVLTSSDSIAEGTGFVYDDRHVVTNQHVVADGERIDVRFHDGGWHHGTVVGTDVYSDLAVVRVPGRPDAATPLQLVESDPPVGTEVIAIGNPFGYSGSVSSGIVSGVDRTLPAANGFSIPDAIQTDAAVNPGNSGGPLVNLDGKVVGVTNAGSGDNIGFAISAPLMGRVVPSLVALGEYDHSYMGVRLMSVTPLVADANDLDRALGVYIDQVLDGTPSDGVLRGSTGTETIAGHEIPTGGDVVVKLDETPVPTRQKLASFLALETRPGTTVDVELVRDGRTRHVDLTLGKRPKP